MKRIKKIWILLLPGIFLIGYNIGTGSITAMAKAGASFGTSLLWSILLSCIITFYLLDRFSLFTIVTGKTAIQGIKQHVHRSVSWFLTFSLVVIILAALLGISGILTDTIHEGLVMLVNLSPDSRWIIAMALGILIFLILNSGTNKSFENVMAAIVGVMGLAFFIAVFYLAPSLSSLLNGLVPTIPDSSSGSENSGFVVIAGMTGTTVSSVVFIIRSLLVKEAGWTVKDMRNQRIDAANSAFFMFLISASVMIVASETLHPNGIRVNNVPELLPIMAPIAGALAVAVMAIGTSAAGLSSVLPNILAIPWIVKDHRGDDRPMKKPSVWLIAGLVIYCTLGTILGIRPVFLMLLSQACLAVLLPVTVISMAYLLHNKKLMGTYAMSWKETIVWVGIIIYSLLMSGLGIQGLVEDLKDVFS